MKRKPKAALLVVCLCLGTIALAAQTQRKPMTNSDVVKLVKADYPEKIIILAIQQSEPYFDSSATALIELKNQGVSEKIIEAMLLLGSDEEVQQTSDIPVVAPNEVTVIDGEMRIPMIRGEISGRASYSFFGIGTSKSLWAFPGSRARLRLISRTPEFEAGILADLDPFENLLIVRLKVRSKRREVQIGRLTYTKQTRDGIQGDVIVESAFEELGTYTASCGNRYKLYRVKPVEPLPPGEYGFTARKLGFPLYDFGVDATP